MRARVGAGGLRIGVLIDRWEPERGGAERALAELVRGLTDAGHDVRVFAERAAADAPGRFERVRVPRRPSLLLRGPRERELAARLVDAADRAGCDATVGIRHLARVTLLWPHAGAHERGLAARDEARGLAPRLPSGRHRVFVALERAALEGGARRVACVSELVRAELAELYPSAVERLRLVPNGVDLQRFHPGLRAGPGARLRAELGVDGRTPLLVFAAREPWLKGLPTLFEALARMPRRAWRLLVAGPRHPSRWAAIAVRAGLSRERVEVRAHVEPEALFAAADLVVHPTWRDPSPLVLLEALACGTPVVTTERAGNAGSIDEIAGEVLPRPGDADLLAAAVERRLARIEAGGADRDAVRSRVLSRGREEWLDRLHGLLLEAVD